MKLDVKGISASEGAEIPFDYLFSAESLEHAGIRPFQAPVHVTGRVFRRSEVFYLELTIGAVLSLCCARCAVPFDRAQTLSLSGVLAEDAENAQSDDVFPMEGTIADLDEIVAGELSLSLEMVTLCREDCKGLCAACGTDLNSGLCGCGEKTADPRLAALSKWLDSHKDHDNE